MRNNLFRLMIVGALIASSAHATEMRTPWIAQRGPLRYTFDKLYEDKRNINWWTAVHYKEAHKAFLKHGTDTHELSALIFNKSDFTLNEIFPDSDVPLNVENYNPFMAITKISPRVSYTEYGVTMGGCIDWPVWCNKGRIGVRATVPFRRIEMERKDSGIDKTDDPLDEFVSSKVFRVNKQADGADQNNAAVDIVVRAYRMDLLQKLRTATADPIMVGRTAADGGGIHILGSQIGVDDPTGNAARRWLTPVAIALTNPATDKPFAHAFMPTDRETNVLLGQYAQAQISTLSNDYATTLPTAGTISVVDARNNAAADYSATFASPGFAANKSSTWLIFHRQTNSPDPEKFGQNVADQAGLGGGIARGIDELLKQFNQNVFTFLANNNFALEDQIRAGMGDIDIDLFYEHMFNCDLMGELCLGVRIPTGGDQDKYGNPYKAILGNGEHWEIKIGGLLAYQPWCFMNIKVDASYNFVIENTEHRMAAFKGAQIKNFGPRADADVDWGYFIGHVDFTFFHPKTQDIRTMIGYEIYYKTEDHVTFKQKQMESWLGQQFVGGMLQPNPKDLDNGLARKHTQSIAHKVRGETSFQINPYFEIYAGASGTFAGQNVMRDRDMHGGFNIRF